MPKLDKLSKIFLNIIVGATIVLLLAAIGTMTVKQPAGQPAKFLPLSENADRPETTKLFFAGDIMLSRHVGEKIDEAADPALPFKNVWQAIQSADIGFANLESPFYDQGPKIREGLVFKAEPENIAGLILAGFDVLAIANNHSLDQGIPGLDFTIDFLNANNIIPAGATSSNKDAVLPVIEKKQILYGFLAYSYAARNDGGKTRHQQIASFHDLEGMRQDIQKLKGHNADIVFVSMHAGVEYTRQPNQEQIDFAHAAIDAGADLVIGHHPHWIQTIEQYKQGWIFYSLGNFVFDQMWSQETAEGLTVLVTYEHKHVPDPDGNTAGEDQIEIKKIELKPVIIENYCCPRWANEEETKNILNQIGLTSSILMDKNN